MPADFFEADLKCFLFFFPVFFLCLLILFRRNAYDSFQRHHDFLLCHLTVRNNNGTDFYALCSLYNNMLPPLKFFIAGIKIIYFPRLSKSTTSFVSSLTIDSFCLILCLSKKYMIMNDMINMASINFKNILYLYFFFFLDNVSPPLKSYFRLYFSFANL